MRLRPNSSVVTIGTAHLRQISQIDRMFETRHGCGGKARCAIGLRQQRVALVAILADDFAVGADVLAVVTAEASGIVEVPQVVGMRLPVQLHFGKRSSFEDLLNLSHGVANLQLLRLGDFGIFTFVVARYSIRDSLHGRVGAGTTNGNVGPGSVTLGRIGLGYLYTDFIPQISWTSPSVHGLQFGAGMFTPLSDVVSTTLGFNGSGAAIFSAPLTGHGQPQFQTKLTYKVPAKGKIKTNLWTNFMTQSLEANNADTVDPYLKIPVGQNVQAWGIDYGAKLSIGAADFVAYGYNGSGIGTEGLYFLATSPAGQTRGSQGYYLQGTYTFV